mmetsp:Transcript_4068/g.14475  ORF Transcript_4068/g.14475 Transcript_4068/m.14475 type:complete len:123 (+) Transcript_4068:1-369(+)
MECVLDGGWRQAGERNDDQRHRGRGTEKIGKEEEAIQWPREYPRVDCRLKHRSDTNHLNRTDKDYAEQRKHLSYHKQMASRVYVAHLPWCNSFRSWPSRQELRSLSNKQRTGLNHTRNLKNP